MSAFHLLQALLWLAAVLWAARSMRALLFTGAIDSAPIVARLARPDGEVVADDLLEHARPSWVGEVGTSQLSESEADADERLASLRGAALRGLASLMTLGRIAPPLAFLGVILELTRAFAGGAGLEALQRGLPERIALERSALGVCIGALTAVFCFAVARQLLDQLRTLERDVRRVRVALDDMTSPEGREER